MKPRHLLAAALFWIVVFVTLGCEPSTGEIASSKADITSVCYSNIGGVTGIYPWNANYPIGSQHVACEHQPAAFAQAYWAPNVSPCTPAGHETPGNYQVDVWSRDYATPTNYYCARVTVPQTGHYALNYWEVMERGWVASYPDGSHHRIIDGVEVGPGLAGMLSVVSDVFSQGCQPAPPYGNCVSFVNWLASGQTPWIQIGGIYNTMVSLNFYAIGMMPP